MYYSQAGDTLLLLLQGALLGGGSGVGEGGRV